MALTQINTFSNIGNSDIDNAFLSLNKMFIGHDKLTLTEMDTTTVPEIAEGSIIEIGGALFLAESDESISTTDPHTSSTVADGTVYIFINGTTGLAYFTATAPTWDDDKQGWYGTSTYANYRYVGECEKSSSNYRYKYVFDFRNRDRVKTIEFDVSISAGNNTATITHYLTSPYTNNRIKRINSVLKINTTGGEGGSGEFFNYYSFNDTSLYAGRSTTTYAGSGIIRVEYI